MTVETSFKNLLTRVGALLREKGFRRTGNAFCCSKQGNWAVISFQRSTKSSAQSIVFTVNLGVASGSLLKFFGQPKDHAHKIDQCHWRQRLGFTLPEASDRWWCLDADQDPEGVVGELSDAIMNSALPVIEEHLPDDALRAVWESGTAPGITETDRLRYLSALLKIQGSEVESKEAAASLRAGAQGRPTADLAGLHLARLDFWKSSDEQLVGRWVTDPADSESLAEYGEVSLDFGPNGRLTYTIHLEGKRQIMLFTYRVEGNVLVIDQPSEPHEERTSFEMTPSGKLVVFSQPVSSTYVKVGDVEAPGFPKVKLN